MAWYYGTFSCGHDGRINVVGPMKNRQWIVNRKFENMCEECYARKVKEEREKNTIESIEKAKEMELIQLEGSEKQIAWAETLRQKLIQNFEDYKEEIDIKNLILNYILETKNKAFFYIDNRNTSVRDFIEKYKNEVTQDFLSEKLLEKDLIYEAAVSPIEIKHDGIVEIRVTLDKIEVFYNKNKAFIDIVKSLNYIWSGCWTRNLKETTGTYIDRAAELGNKLLNNGFIVSIQDEDIRNKAINGDYKKECSRWIYKSNKPNKLLIKWKGQNNQLYNTSKRLPTARWDNGIHVDVSKYKEVEEFAELYGFKFTKEARKFIENYIININSLKRVNPKKIDVIRSKNGLRGILDSSREILEDLMEEDD